ncbi:MAG: hypothetical protein AAF108_00790 [Planctomycetota bacterium]
MRDDVTNNQSGQGLRGEGTFGLVSAESDSAADTDAGDPPPRPRGLEEDLEEAREQIARLESDLSNLMARRDLEDRLRAAGAVDVEAASILVRALLEREAGSSDGAPLSVESAVEELVRTRPFLFNGGGDGLGYGSAMAGVTAAASDLDRVAERARATGDRRTLLRYLRLRRGEH